MERKRRPGILFLMRNYGFMPRRYSHRLKKIHKISTEMCADTYTTTSSVYAVVIHLLSYTMKPKKIDFDFMIEVSAYFASTWRAASMMIDLCLL